MLSWWKALMDLLYPPKCPDCAKLTAAHGHWCDGCVQKLAADRMISPAAHRLRSLDACRALYEYESSLKRIMHEMKFRQGARYGIYLDWLLERSGFQPEREGVQCVVPVPLHAKRLRSRGFNQTELIFKNWTLRRGLPWMEALGRVKETQPQWELSLTQRRDNIRGAFAVIDPGLVAGKNILLVDDIFTSGLTLDECAKELKKAAAGKIYGLTLASSAQ